MSSKRTDDTIKAVATVRSNIEEECHEWFDDASRLADKIGATVSLPVSSAEAERSFPGLRRIKSYLVQYV